MHAVNVPIRALRDSFCATTRKVYSYYGGQSLWKYEEKFNGCVSVAEKIDMQITDPTPEEIICCPCGFYNKAKIIDNIAKSKSSWQSNHRDKIFQRTYLLVALYYQFSFFLTVRISNFQIIYFIKSTKNHSVTNCLFQKVKVKLFYRSSITNNYLFFSEYKFSTVYNLYPLAASNFCNINLHPLLVGLQPQTLCGVQLTVPKAKIINRFRAPRDLPVKHERTM